MIVMEQGMELNSVNNELKFDVDTVAVVNAAVSREDERREESVAKGIYGTPTTPW